MSNTLHRAILRLLHTLCFAALLAACGGDDQQSYLDANDETVERNQGFISPSGITAEDFSIAIADFIGARLKDTVSGLQLEEFYQGLQDGLNGEEETAYSIEDITAALSLIEASQQLQHNEPYTPDSQDLPVISYAMGFIQGSQAARLEISLDLDTFKNIFATSYAEGSDNLEQSRETVTTYASELQQYNLERIAAEGEENLAQAREFLAKNREREDIKETATGLQYEVIVEGGGTKPTAADRVKVHYRGRLLNGEEFDSSYARNQPIDFSLSGVIPGWTEGLQLMNTGASYRFFIPPELGYGSAGSPPRIGANELLIFEVELLEVL